MAELIVSAVLSAAASAVVGFATRELTKEGSSEAAKRRAVAELSASSSLISPLSVTPDPGGPQIGFFGRRRVGGRVVVSATSGNQNFLLLVLAGAPINGIHGVYINNKLVRVSAGGNVLDSPWVDTAGTTSINVAFYTGAQLAADSSMDAAFVGWTANHIGKNQTYVRIIMNPNNNPTFFEKTFQPMPDFTFECTGFKCYDPRNGAHVLGTPSTYTYSDNVSICRANYLIHELGCGFPASLVNWTAVAAAADIDDQIVTLASGGTEKRYTCSAYWTTDQRHEDVLAKFNAANGGTIAPLGDKYFSLSGAATGTTADVTPDDYADEGLTFSDFSPLSARVNGVRGKFTSPIHNYEPRDFPAYQDATALAEDAAGFGIASSAADDWLDLDLEFVTSHTQAQRLGRIAYKKARYGVSGRVALQFTHFDTVSGDTILLTDDAAGILAATFRVTGDSLEPDFTVRLSIELDDPGFYNWTAATDEKVFEAEAALLGETGTIIPPGAAMYGTTGSNLIIALYKSPSDGADLYQILAPGGTTPGDFPVSTVTQQVISGASSVSPVGTPWQVRAKNSATGDVSAYVSLAIVGASVSYGTMSTYTATTTPYRAIAAPKAPRVLSAHSGSARLRLFASPNPTCNGIQLFSSASSDPATATLVSGHSNAQTEVTVTGAAGTAKVYWLKANDTVLGINSPFSQAALVVF